MPATEMKGSFSITPFVPRANSTAGRTAGLH